MNNLAFCISCFTLRCQNIIHCILLPSSSDWLNHRDIWSEWVDANNQITARNVNSFLQNWSSHDNIQLLPPEAATYKDVVWITYYNRLFLVIQYMFSSIRIALTHLSRTSFCLYFVTRSDLGICFGVTEPMINPGLIKPFNSLSELIHSYQRIII